MRRLLDPTLYALLIVLVVFLLVVNIILQTDRIKRTVVVDPPVIVDLYDPMLEGKAKALLIEELTGRQFPPEVARWVNITITGTAVSIDTEKLNVWLGRNWESK